MSRYGASEAYVNRLDFFDSRDVYRHVKIGDPKMTYQTMTEPEFRLGTFPRRVRQTSVKITEAPRVINGLAHTWICTMNRRPHLVVLCPAPSWIPDPAPPPGYSITALGNLLARSLTDTKLTLAKVQFDRRNETRVD